MKFSYTEEKKRLLKLTGVPSGLLYDCTIKIKDHVRSYNEEIEGKPPFTLSIADQMKVYTSLDKLPGQPRRIVLSSNDDITLLRKFMVPWFYNAVAFAKENSNIALGTLPVWQYVDFSFNDKLLDALRGKDTELSFSEYKPLLVLDGISTDSSSNKIEKTRDILNLSLDHTVVLLLGGSNPFNFCQTRLSFTPKELAIFSTARNRSVL